MHLCKLECNLKLMLMLMLMLRAVCRYDNCNCQAEDPIIDRFTDMRDALNRTGRPVVFSMCLWGTGDAWRWGAQVGGAVWHL